MKSTVFAGALLAGATALALGPTAIASAQPLFGGPGPSGSNNRPAVFVQTDNPAGNQVIVLAEHGDGRLSEVATVSTGGLGGQASGAAVDELASQGSLVYDPVHRLLFAVNAGSGTLSVFSAQGRSLQLLQVVSSGGEFPDSVAVHGNLVYVLDGGGTGAVMGYQIFGNHLFPLPGDDISLGLTNTDPPNYLMEPGQIGFSPNGSEVIVTTKLSTSSIDIFQVRPNGVLSATPTVTPDPGNVPFSFVFTPAGQLVTAEAGPSALHTWALGNAGTLTSLVSLGDGQAALCWITTAGGYYYVANAGSNDLSGYSIAPNGTPTLVGATGVVATTDAGPIDIAASQDGSTVYSEDGGAGAVDEFHVNGGGSLTDLGSVAGLGAGIEGIATD
jgi:6-phosphogluconolactonase (cycloisomerase 2 family)